MKTIEKILTATVILGALYYLAPECTITDVYIKSVPSGQINHVEIQQGKCYLIQSK